MSKSFIPIWNRDGNKLIDTFYQEGGKKPFRYISKEVRYKNKRNKIIQVTHYVVFEHDSRYKSLLIKVNKEE